MAFELRDACAPRLRQGQRLAVSACVRAVPLRQMLVQRGRRSQLRRAQAAGAQDGELVLELVCHKHKKTKGLRGTRIVDQTIGTAISVFIKASRNFMSLKETRAGLPESRLTNLLIGVMPRGHYTTLDKNSQISKREHHSLHRGLLGGMTVAQRGEIRFNPNLSSGLDRWLHERVYSPVS